MRAVAGLEYVMRPVSSTSVITSGARSHQGAEPSLAGRQGGSVPAFGGYIPVAQDHESVGEGCRQAHPGLPLAPVDSPAYRMVHLGGAPLFADPHQHGEEGAGHVRIALQHQVAHPWRIGCHLGGRRRDQDVLEVGDLCVLANGTRHDDRLMLTLSTASAMDKRGSSGISESRGSCTAACTVEGGTAFSRRHHPTG